MTSFPDEVRNFRVKIELRNKTYFELLIRKIKNLDFEVARDFFIEKRYLYNLKLFEKM